MNKIALFGAAGAIGQSIAKAVSAQGAPPAVEKSGGPTDALPAFGSPQPDASCVSTGAPGLFFRVAKREGRTDQPVTARHRQRTLSYEMGSL
jgi:hypothetical protein